MEAASEPVVPDPPWLVGEQKYAVFGILCRFTKTYKRDLSQGGLRGSGRLAWSLDPKSVRLVALHPRFQAIGDSAIEEDMRGID